jgi:hypothetical protein
MTRRNPNTYAARHQPAANPSHVRPNEGTRVSVVLGQIASTSGLSLQTAAINLAQAPVPERKYVADAYGVNYSSGAVQLLFGQRRIGGSDLRSLLVIQMSPTGAARFLATSNQLAPLSLTDMATQYGIVAEKSFQISTEPSQTVALAAGLSLMAAAADEATIDFYQASAFALSAMLHSSELALDPVVRIDLRTSLLLGLFEDLRKLTPQLPNHVVPETTK